MDKKLSQITPANISDGKFVVVNDYTTNSPSDALVSLTQVESALGVNTLKTDVTNLKNQDLDNRLSDAELSISTMLPSVTRFEDTVYHNFNGQVGLDAIRTNGIYVNTGTLTGNSAATFGANETIVVEHKVQGGIHQQFVKTWGINFQLDREVQAEWFRVCYDNVNWTNWNKFKDILDVSGLPDTIAASYGWVSGIATDVDDLKSGLITDWTFQPSDSNFPSEKMMKTKLDLKADKLSSANTFKANGSGVEADEQEYPISAQGITLMELETAGQVREELECEISSEGYNITSSNSTVQIPLNINTNNRYILITQSGISTGNHIVKLPNCNKYTRFLVQVFFSNSNAVDITIKDYNNNTVCVIPNPNDNTVYPYVDVIVNNAGSAENWNEHNVVGTKIDSLKTVQSAKDYLQIPQTPNADYDKYREWGTDFLTSDSSIFQSLKSTSGNDTLDSTVSFNHLGVRSLGTGTAAGSAYSWRLTDKVLPIGDSMTNTYEFSCSVKFSNVYPTALATADGYRVVIGFFSDYTDWQGGTDTVHFRYQLNGTIGAAYARNNATLTNPILLSNDYRNTWMDFKIVWNSTNAKYYYKADGSTTWTLAGTYAQSLLPNNNLLYAGVGITNNYNSTKNNNTILVDRMNLKITKN